MKTRPYGINQFHTHEILDTLWILTMHPRTHELLDFLAEQRALLRTAFDEVPAALRNAAPAPGQWSPAEIIEHVSIANRRIAKLLSKKIAEAKSAGIGADASTEPVLPTIDIPRMLDRARRFTAPEIVLPKGLRADIAWAELERSTIAVREAIAQGDGLALSEIRYPHPLLGPLSLYAWIALVGAHEGRHAQQIREVFSAH